MGRMAVIGCGLAAALAAAGLASGATAGLTSAQAAYCRAKGGTVQVRVPVFGTNQPRGMRLAGSLEFCRFTSAKDGSRISVDLGTLTASRPTLAALAYYRRAPAASSNPNANPASRYCSQVGGTDLFGGVNAAGGGWVLRGGGNATALDLCVFPDRSTIDAFGSSTARAASCAGVDLAGVLRFPAPPSG